MLADHLGHNVTRHTINPNPQKNTENFFRAQKFGSKIPECRRSIREIVTRTKRVMSALFVDQNRNRIGDGG